MSGSLCQLYSICSKVPKRPTPNYRRHNSMNLVVWCFHVWTALGWNEVYCGAYIFFPLDKTLNWMTQQLWCLFHFHKICVCVTYLDLPYVFSITTFVLWFQPPSGMLALTWPATPRLPAPSLSSWWDVYFVISFSLLASPTVIPVSQWGVGHLSIFISHCGVYLGCVWGMAEEVYGWCLLFGGLEGANPSNSGQSCPSFQSSNPSNPAKSF